MSTIYYQPGSEDDLFVRNPGSLALWAPLLAQMNLQDIFDQHLPQHTNADHSHGQALINLLAARLSGPTALMNVQDWAQQHAAELFFDVPAEKLNDDRLGRALDALYTQRQSILTSIALHVAQEFNLPLDQLHYDPTDLHFTGRYDTSVPCGVKAPIHTNKTKPADPDRDDPAHITLGHTSKKHKIVHAGIACVVDDLGAVPIFGHVTSGNHNGHIAVAEMFTAWKDHLQPQKLMLCSDRGTWSVGHLVRLHNEGFHQITPAPWKDFREVYEQQRLALKWTEATYLSQEQQRRRQCNSRLPRETYHLAVHRHQIEDPDSDRVIGVRLIFVKSSAQRKVIRSERRKKLKKLWAQLKKVQANVARGHSRTEQSTITETLAKYLRASTVSELVEWSIEPLSTSEQKALPKPGRGCRRPTYRIVLRLKRDQWKKKRRDDGISVLVTNVPRRESADALFTTFKKQIYVEQSHHQWKTPLAVRPLFLKNPKRVEALTHLMMIALMAWHLLQRKYRLSIPPASPKSGNEKTPRTTTEQLLRPFSVLVVHFHTQPEGHSVEVMPLSQQQKQILTRLQYPTPKQTFCRKFATIPT